MNRKTSFFLILLIILAAVGVSLWAYPKLPDKMASHWGVSGQVDGWMSKSVCVWIIPGMMVGLTLLFFGILLIDPLRKNIDKFFGYYAGFVIIFNLFLLAGHGWMILWNLGIQISVNIFMPIGMACLIFYTGIVLDHVKPNWFIGIRTPWTLSNEIVWQKTHKLCGILFRIAAIIVLIGAVFPKYAIIFVLAPVLSAVLVTVLYSLWLGVGGKRPHKKYLSPFFVILLLALVLAFTLPMMHSMLFSTPAFAEAVAPLLNAKVVSFQMSSTMQMGKTEVKQGPMYCTWQTPSRMRVEMSEGNTVVVSDMQADKIRSLMLMPDDKTAMKMEIALPSVEDMKPDEFYTDFFDMRERICRARETGTAESLSASVIDGKKVIGYRICETKNNVNIETTLWIDPKTYLPVQTESTMIIGTMRMSDKETDFDFDKQVAPDFFSMDVPEGYTLLKSPIDLTSLKAPDEKSLIEMFHLWTQYTAGKFPPDLTMESYQGFAVEKMDEILGHDPNEFEHGLETMTSRIGQLASGIVFVQTLPKESDWHYAGKDATLGDSKTPIFWYRPTDSSTYRVIYGDLSVKDVPSENLPLP